MEAFLIDDQELRRIVSVALREDLGASGDITTRAVIPCGLLAAARIVAREAGVLAGWRAAELSFLLADAGLKIMPRRRDGDRFETGDTLGEIEGQARGILAAERTALNFLQHLSGIATLTARFVEAATPYRAGIFDTRKTIPGLRSLEKAAVLSGGGNNHRMNLCEAVLIKDNHRAAAGRLVKAVSAAREIGPGLTVEVEADTWEQMEEALDAGADIILLDNWPAERVGEAVERVKGACLLEASGGITLESVARYAATGVDRISVGRITQGAPPIDMSLEMEMLS